MTGEDATSKQKNSLCVSLADPRADGGFFPLILWSTCRRESGAKKSKKARNASRSCANPMETKTCVKQKLDGRWLSELFGKTFAKKRLIRRRTSTNRPDEFTIHLLTSLQTHERGLIMVSGISQTPRPSVNRLENVLLGYIAAAMPGQIPGCDGMTTHHMLQDYAEMSAKGLVPAHQHLSRCHPDLTEQLEQYFGRPALIS